MEADAPIDVGRMSRPEADAFRYIAKALGAEFAGDMPDEFDPSPLARLSTDVLLNRWDKPKGSMLDVAPVDAKARDLLERMPVAALVIVNDDVAFINRAAVVLFGYTSANILEAAGGMGALFAGGGPGRPGVMPLRTAGGRTFGARVTMATIEWGGERAMLLTAMPDEMHVAEVPATTRAPGRDLLMEVLDANPAPIALVTRGGHIELCNRAFDALAPLQAKARLEDRLTAADLEHVFDVMSLSFLLADGQARTTKAVAIGSARYTVSVGALRDGQLSVLVFHKQLTADDVLPMFPPVPGEGRAETMPEAATPFTAPDPAWVPDLALRDFDADARANDDGAPEPQAAAEDDAISGTPLFRAVCDVRRLVRDAAFLVVTEEDEAVATPAAPAAVAEVNLLRMVLLTLAMRGDAHAVLTLRRDGERILIDVPAAPTRALERVAESDRVAEAAIAAEREVKVRMDGRVTIAPLELPEDMAAPPAAAIIDFAR